MFNIQWIPLEKSKYDTFCVICHIRILSGNSVEWAKGVGVRHLKCGKKYEFAEKLRLKSRKELILGNLKKSQEICNKWLRADPIIDDDIEVLANKCFDEQNFEAAEKLNEILVSKHNDVKFKMNLAASLSNNGKPKQAIIHVKKALKIEPENDSIKHELASLYGSLGNTANQIKLLKQIFQNSKDLNILYEISSIYAEKNDNESIIKISEQILKKQPDNLSGNYRKLLALMNMITFEEDQNKILQKIHKHLKNKSDADTKFLKMYFEFITSKGKTLNEYDFENTSPTVLLIMIQRTFENKLYDQVFPLLDIVKKRKFSNPIFDLFLAKTLFEKGELDKAKTLFLKISRKIGISSVYEDLMTIHSEQKDMKSATKLAQKMLKENPLHEKSLTFLSMIYDAVGFFDDAISLQKRLMNANPEKSSHKIALGRILLKSAQYEQVLSHYKENKISKNDKIFSDSHQGHALIGLNNIDDALSLFKSILKENDDFDDALSGLAICYLRKNELELAANAITKCRDIKNKREEGHLDTLLIEQQNNRQNSNFVSERVLSNSVEIITKPTFRFNPDKKTTDKGIERTFLIALSSLLNSKGGVIQIGIDGEKIPGLSRDLQLLSKTNRNDSGFKNEIFRIIKNGIVTGIPNGKITITFPITKKIKICEVYVRKSDYPIFVKNIGKDEGFYIREKGETIKVKPADQTNYIQKNFLNL